MIDLLSVVHRTVHVPESPFARPLQWAAVILWAAAAVTKFSIYIGARQDVKATRTAPHDVRFRAASWMHDIRTRAVATFLLTLEAATWLVVAAPQPGLALVAAGLNTVAALLFMVNAILANRAEAKLLDMEFWDGHERRGEDGVDHPQQG